MSGIGLFQRVGLDRGRCTVGLAPMRLRRAGGIEQDRAKHREQEQGR